MSGAWFATWDYTLFFGVITFSSHDIYRKNLILGRHWSPRILNHRLGEEVEFADWFVRSNCSTSILFTGSVGCHSFCGHRWSLFGLLTCFLGRVCWWWRHLQFLCVRVAQLSEEISTLWICLACQFEFDGKPELLPRELFGSRSLAQLPVMILLLRLICLLFF